MNTDHASDRMPAKNAPHPDDARKPDGPTDLKKRSWMYVLRKTAREFRADQCIDIAASLTYYAVLALFPALIAIFSLLGVVGQRQSGADAILGIVDAAKKTSSKTSSNPRSATAQSKPAAPRSPQCSRRCHDSPRTAGTAKRNNESSKNSASTLGNSSR